MSGPETFLWALALLLLYVLLAVLVYRGIEHS